MNYQIDLRSFFLILAALQALIFASLLISRGIRQHRLSDKLLAAFLIALAATLSEHIAGWMGWYKTQALTFFPFGNNFLFAPLSYLYVKSITNIAYRLRGKEWLHFLPAAVYFIIHFSIWPMDVAVKLKLLELLAQKQYYFIEGTIDLLILTIYTLLSIFHYRAYLKWLQNEFSNITPLTLTWLRNFLIILVVVCVIELAFNIIGLFYSMWYDVRYWDYFVRAILLYYLSVAGYMFTQHGELIFSTVNVTKPESIAINSKATTENLPTHQLLAHLQSAKPYLDAELTLQQLAQQLNLPTSLVSQTINTGLGKNFNDFINEYRVTEICTRLKAGEHKSKTLLGVGMDSGFNSKATFNRSFKKVTSLTPKKWVYQHTS
jgi:AraC-like DNA-binding protein